MGKVLLVVAFLTLTPTVLLASLISLISISPSKDKPEIPNKTVQIKNGASVYASLPASIPSISTQISVKDARPAILRAYLKAFNSPLLPFADEIVNQADKYGIDYRLIPAIARQESALCNFIPPESYNCWGWGITSVSSVKFDSYLEGIETVTKGLKENYIDKGLVTPEQIMTKYTPNSPNGAWAKGVTEFMSDLQ
jgi:hypothetical protein